VRALPWILLALVALFPWMGLGNYPLHLIIMILVWSFVYTSWSLNGALSGWCRSGTGRSSASARTR